MNKKRKSPEAESHGAMMQRCYNPRRGDYKHYGARGIRVCERWHKLSEFIEDMAPRPPGRTLERINKNGNYEPSNCRWATRAEQSRNTRKNVRINIEGETRLLIDWCRHFGINISTVRTRRQRGLSWKRAFTDPSRYARV